MAEEQEFWGVCYGDDENGWEIDKVYKSRDAAMQEALFATHETQVSHVVKPVYRKS